FDDYVLPLDVAQITDLLSERILDVRRSRTRRLREKPYRRRPLGLLCVARKRGNEKAEKKAESSCRRMHDVSLPLEACSAMATRSELMDLRHNRNKGRSRSCPKGGNKRAPDHPVRSLEDRDMSPLPPPRACGREGRGKKGDGQVCAGDDAAD